MHPMNWIMHILIWPYLSIYLYILSQPRKEDIRTSAFIFLVLNLPVPIGRLTPAASSIFNTVSSVTLLSPWGAGFPCVRREGVSVHHTALSCFLLLFFFFFVFFLMFWSSLSSWALHNYTAKQHYRLQCWTDLSSNWGSSVLYRKMSRIPNIAVVVVNCHTLKITFNRNQPTTARINPNIQLTYRVDVYIHSNTEKLNCRHSFDTWNTEIDNLCGEKPRNYWLHLDMFTLKS